MSYEATYAHDEATSETIDPERPWITDPEDDLSRMSWFKTMFSPLGKLPRLHFTRAWTFMFMARLLIVVVPLFASMLIGVAGADASAVKMFMNIGAGIIFPLTIITSLFAHMKRLSHAGKSPAWAGLVLAPLIMAAAAFVFVATQNVSQANEIAEEVAFAKENPEAAKEKAKAKREAAAAAGEDEQGSAQAQAGRGGPGGMKDFDATGYVVSKAMPAAMMAWAFTALIIMLWTLLWVARLPGTFAASAQSGAKSSYEV